MAIDTKTLDALMHAFLDGQLSPNATKKIIKYIKEHPARSDELKKNKKIKNYIVAAFNPILELPVSDRLQSIISGQNPQLVTASGVDINVESIDFNLSANAPANQPVSDNNPSSEGDRHWNEVISHSLHSHSGHIVLVSSFVFLLGLFIGYLYPKTTDTEKLSKNEFTENLALSAHQTYASEDGFSVHAKPGSLEEFKKMYSIKIGADISPVKLDEIGLELMGGQVLPSLNKKAIFYMYRSVSNERLSIYMRRHLKQTGRSAYFCYASRSDKLNICSWRGQTLTYYVISDQPADIMEAIVQDISTRLSF